MSKTAVVTGASQGIGKEICVSLAARGYNLIMISSNKEKLLNAREEIINTAPYICALPLCYDLTKEDAPQKIYDELCGRNIYPDILVNNAGFGNFGLYDETSFGKDSDMIRLNILCLMHMTKLFLPDMKKRGRGKILNVSSVAAYAPGPYMSVYYASKAFVSSFSNAIAHECKGSGVTVTTLCPGPADTGFADRAAVQKSKIYGWFKGAAALSPEEVAEKGVCGLLKGKRNVFCNLSGVLVALGGRLAPSPIGAAIVDLCQAKKDENC